jgi:cell division protein FtsZ
VADPDANVIYGIVTDEAMGNAVKVTVIATGFTRGPRKAVPTPVDLANYMNTPPAAAPAAGAASAGGDFYRKTPNAKAAAGGSRFDLDVPAFLRRKGGEGTE